MRKKILTVLAPVLAIMAFAVLPAMAQASTPNLQINGSSAGLGGELQATSANLKTQTALGNLRCGINDLNIFLFSNHHGAVNGGGFEECEIEGAGVPVDITTNAGLGWQVIFNENDEGEVKPLAAAEGGAAENIAFTAQIQNGEEESLKTCTFTRASVPFTYNQGADLVITVKANTVFNGGACGNGTLEGSFSVAPTGEPTGQVVID